MKTQPTDICVYRPKLLLSVPQLHILCRHKHRDMYAPFYTCSILSENSKTSLYRSIYVQCSTYPDGVAGVGDYRALPHRLMYNSNDRI